MVHHRDRSASPVTTPMWCSTIRTVFFSSLCTERITSTSPARRATAGHRLVEQDHLLVGGDEHRGSSFRLSPCGSEPRAAPRVVEPDARAPSARARLVASDDASRQIRIAPPRLASTASRTFSSTDSCGNTLEIWNVRPSPACVRACTGSSVTSRPASSIRPPVGRIRPERRLNSVVFPAPFGPMMPRNSPRAPRARHRRRSWRRRCRARAVESSGSRSSSTRLRGASGRRHVPGRERLHRNRAPLAVHLARPHLEHRLEHRVVGLADPLRHPSARGTVPSSSALIIRSTSSPPRETARWIICAVTNPSGVKMSGTWFAALHLRLSQVLTLFFGASAT